ncbi:MAG: magnesium transporter CorA family protein [Alphaproteobacteria bacterium]|nr:magnesium transporter CorA family protein [Alphaproteobacteria bacterium]
MLRAFVSSGGRIEQRQLNEPAEPIPAAVWYDLIEPSPAEIRGVEQSLGIELPRREEMQEIEISSRLYQDGPALFMTTTVMSQAETPQPTSDAITFVVTPSALVTLRYSQPLAFTNFSNWVQRTPSACGASDMALMGLMEAIVDRAADVLERTSIEIDTIARGVFETRATSGVHGGTLQDALKGIGRHGTLISGISESLLSLSRANAFFSTSASTWLHKESKTRVKTLDRDIRSLHDHGTFLAQKVNFLLDATLGLINIEQNNIIKIFSVAAVAFLPPTLIASIYGMNFKEFPELNWIYGYPFALALMVLSAALPFYYFRRRGWL